MKSDIIVLLLLLLITELSGQNFYKINFAGDPQTVFVQNITQSKSTNMLGSDTLLLKFKGTSVLETGLEHLNLTIYPNPMDQSCNFDFENIKKGKVVIQVFKANGSQIYKYSKKLPQGIQYFQLSGVPAGVYLIDVKTITGHFSGSFVSTDMSNTPFLLINKCDSEDEADKVKKTNSYNNSNNTNIPLAFRNSVELDFATGDQLMFIGYLSGFENDTVYASPTGDQIITFSFCSKPEQPSSSNHIPFQTQIIWSWNTSIGATGYKYNTVNNFAAAIDNGNSTNFTQSGLTCNTGYTLYVWAYNSCGNSEVLQLSQSTSSCSSSCGSSVTFIYNGIEVTYGTVTSAGGRCWLDRNLGAADVAINITDATAYGDMFQWGRLDDGHQVRTSPTTITLSSNNVPGHNKFIKAPNSPFDWISPQNPNLWKGVNGINNPCPTGYRPPTDTEWNIEFTSWSTPNAEGAFASPLKLLMAGYRDCNESIVYGEGLGGIYWSCTVSDGSSWYLGFDNSDVTLINDGNRAHGMSVRCIKD